MKIKQTGGLTTFQSINGNQFQFSYEKKFQKKINKKENHFTVFPPKTFTAASLEQICGSSGNRYIV